MTLRTVAAYLRGAVLARRLRGPPVIIGGCERSGTTILLAILSAHPHIVALDETWAFCFGPEAGFPGSSPIRPLRLYRHLGEAPLRGRERRWCEKSPANIFYFHRIREHFGGRVRFIQVVRDGREVVMSEHPARPGHPWVSVRRWKQAVTAGLAHARDPDVITVRYSDLLLDSKQTIARILTHIGEDATEEIESWHEHTAIRSSVNLATKVRPLHVGSLRKFERDGYPHVERARALMRDPEAVRLLAHYGFLGHESPHPS